ncbi:hypothetical protein [Rhodanobacter koreensis]
MSLKDWLTLVASFIAVSISCISLVASILSYKFNRQVKLVELKGSLLVKGSEAAIKVDLLRHLSGQIQKHAESINDKSIVEENLENDVVMLQKDLVGLLTTLSNVSHSDAVKVYEAIGHQLHEFDGRVSNVLSRVQRFHDLYRETGTEEAKPG